MFTKSPVSNGKPLMITAGFGVAFAIGTSAAAISPVAANALAPLVTAVTCSASSACVSGTNSGSGPGVSGTSAKGTGVSGTSTSSYGLIGTSSSGVGVKAVSKTSSAIFASNDASSYATINAQQTGKGNALAGTASVGAGVYGFSEGIGGYFESGGTAYGPYALYGRSDSADGFMLGGSDSKTNAEFYVDSHANFFANSFTTFTAIRSNHTTVDGRRVAAYAAESSSATLEDFGSGRLANGVAVVPLERTFRQTIDARGGYSVFLTAGGDNRGLYVQKSPGSFTVREAQGGRSTLAFDYRIVAHPADGAAGRLPAAAPEHPPLSNFARAH